MGRQTKGLSFCKAALSCLNQNGRLPSPEEQAKNMGNRRTMAPLRAAPVGNCVLDRVLPGPAASRAACLSQLLLAFCDIADRDDIHQAAQRLEFVQQWIRDEAERAASDPLFADLVPI